MSRCPLRLNTLRAFADANIVLSAGGDASCTEPDPILWLQRACNHSVPEQSLSIQQALRMCTYNGAWVTFDEGDRGSLEVGKLADMVILSRNPYDMQPEELESLRVEGLILSGKPYEKQDQSFLGVMLRGMLSRGAS